MTRDELSILATTARQPADSTGEDQRALHGLPRDEAIVQAAEIRRHVTDHFLLEDAFLRDAQSGRWNACQIADALGVSLEEFARMVGESDRAISETPDGADLQERLAPFANILAMVSDYHGGDASRVRTWLNQPQPRLGNRSPLTALRTPGRSTALEQWIAGIWLGDGD